MQNITLVDIGSLLIVGTVVSLVQQWLKSTKWTSLGKKFFLVVLSIIAASFYIYFKDSAFWATFIAILAIASTMYALFIKDLFPKG